MIPTTRTLAAAALAAGPFLAACSSADSALAPAPRRAVTLAVTAHASQNTPTVPGLQVSAVRLVLGAASLGSGSQFGCINCQGNTQDAPAGTAPATLVTLAGTSGTATVATSDVAAGTYSAAQIDVVRPSTPLIGTSPDQTVEVTGSYNGTPFTVTAAAAGSFVQTLSPPVQVTAGATAPISITIDLPVASWFTGTAGPLDPAVPAQRAAIVANIQRFFSATDGTPEGSEPPSGEG